MKAYVFNEISKTILEIEICDFSAGNYNGKNFCSFRFRDDGPRYCLSFFNETSEDGYRICFLKKPTKNQIKKLRKFLGEDICLRSSIWERIVEVKYIHIYTKINFSFIFLLLCKLIKELNFIRKIKKDGKSQKNESC